MNTVLVFLIASLLTTAAPIIITGGSVTVISAHLGGDFASVRLTGPGLNLYVSANGTTFGYDPPPVCRSTCSYDFSQAGGGWLSREVQVVDGQSYSGGSILTFVSMNLFSSVESATPVCIGCDGLGGHPFFYTTTWGSTPFSATGTITIIDQWLPAGSQILYTGTFSGLGTAIASSNVESNNDFYKTVTYTFSTTPEPVASQMWAAGLVGLMGLIGLRHRRQRKTAGISQP
jgi:hypothetical protein